MIGGVFFNVVMPSAAKTLALNRSKLILFPLTCNDCAGCLCFVGLPVSASL